MNDIDKDIDRAIAKLNILQKELRVKDPLLSHAVEDVYKPFIMWLLAAKYSGEVSHQEANAATIELMVMQALEVMLSADIRDPDEIQEYANRTMEMFAKRLMAYLNAYNRDFNFVAVSKGVMNDDQGGSGQTH